MMIYLKVLKEGCNVHKESWALLKEKLYEDFKMIKEDVRFLKNEFEKPYLLNEDTYFSISHCRNIASVIIDKKNVGIDIEDIKEINKYALKKSLTEQEKQYVEKSDNPKEEFFKLWTLKESFLKCIGCGLSYGMKNVEFRLENNKIICSKKGFSFKICKKVINKTEYIIAATWED